MRQLISFLELLSNRIRLADYEEYSIVPLLRYRFTLVLCVVLEFSECIFVQVADYTEL